MKCQGECLEITRELASNEIDQVAGGVHLGGVLDRVAQYLWSLSLR